MGTVIEPDDIGIMRGNDDARRTPIPAYDADCAAVIGWLQAESTVNSDKIATLGFCIGGHLAFRAAFAQEIKAAVCCYPTGIPSGKLGLGIADTIHRINEITGEMLLVLGSLDPHIPEHDRHTLIMTLEQAALHICGMN